MLRQAIKKVLAFHFSKKYKYSHFLCKKIQSKYFSNSQISLIHSFSWNDSNNNVELNYKIAF